MPIELLCQSRQAGRATTRRHQASSHFGLVALFSRELLKGMLSESTRKTNLFRSAKGFSQILGVLRDGNVTIEWP